MVFVNQSIKVQNVVSKKATAYTEDIEFEIDKFIKEVKNMGGQPTTNIFYMIPNIPRENKAYEMEFFIVLQKEINSSQANIKFHSYFGIGNMISIRVVDTNKESMISAYRHLIEGMDSNHLEPVTGYFHIPGKTSKGNDCVTIRVGYR